MDRKNKFSKSKLRVFKIWPLLMLVFFSIITAMGWFVSLETGVFMSVFWVIVTIGMLVLYFYARRGIEEDIVGFASDFSQVQRGLLKDLAVPYALLDEGGHFVWCNSAFEAILQKDSILMKNISTFFPNITKETIPRETQVKSVEVRYDERDYKVDLRRISIGPQDEKSNGGKAAKEVFKGAIVSAFFFDVTDINKYIKQNYEMAFVAGYIYMDNYDEALETVEDVRRSLLVALIERRVNKYFSKYDAIVKRLEQDKYFAVMSRASFDLMEADRFDVLEDVKTVNIGNQMAVTLSMGFGLDGDTWAKNVDFARNAIDLALGRGGDQAVVKNPNQVSYFGGNSQQVEKNTRVKARVKAHALMEIIQSKELILVMGHQVTDIDSFGAAVGMYLAARNMGKQSHIVINTVTASIRPFIEAFQESDEYEEDLFVSSSEAIQLAGANAAVIVVDTNKPNFTECPELLNLVKTIVVLDHHRMSDERIKNATLSYVETYASSACEMVSEILQYMVDNIKMRQIEADSLYAGIMIDTNNFMTKTGVRTFEAAAFLRRLGADVTRVRKLFRNDLDAYKAKAEAVRNAELYKGAFAISVCPSNVESPTIVGAQAANELLNINQVKASFILTEFQDKIYISARSIDEINVQVIMEKLGGGGHMNIAGAQLVDVNLEEARQILKKTLDSLDKADL